MIGLVGPRAIAGWQGSCLWVVHSPCPFHCGRRSLATRCRIYDMSYHCVACLTKSSWRRNFCCIPCMLVPKRKSCPWRGWSQSLSKCKRLFVDQITNLVLALDLCGVVAPVLSWNSMRWPGEHCQVPKVSTEAWKERSWIASKECILVQDLLGPCSFRYSLHL